MNAIALFYRTTCPYCRKVLNFIEENNISIQLKNVAESSEVLQELITIAGKTQVPCLVIDGQPMHESDLIIEWLKDNLNKNDHT